MLYIDDRWRGSHGIARFSREVLRRLSSSGRPLPAPGIRPTSPLDPLHPGRLALSESDVVFSPGFNAGLTRARQLVTLHDLIHLEVPSESSRMKTLYYERLIRPAVERAGLVLTVSSTSKTAIERWLGTTSRADVVVVGNGRSSAFSPGDVDRGNRPRFAYVGNLKPHKNPAVVLAALEHRPDYLLDLVTSDTATAGEMIRKHGLEGRVHVISGCSDEELAEIYRRSTALLLPSTVEGFGLPAVEAIASGRPVVHAVACASVAEIVGPYGIAVPSTRDSLAWAEAMDAALARYGSRDVVPSSDWHRRYSWDSVAAAVDTAIAQLTREAAIR